MTGKVEIKMIKTSAGPSGCFMSDRKYLVEVEKAKKLVECGAAKWTSDLKKTEKEEVKKPETASTKPPETTEGRESNPPRKSTIGHPSGETKKGNKPVTKKGNKK